jgi:hypothetical protein
MSISFHKGRSRLLPTYDVLSGIESPRIMGFSGTLHTNNWLEGLTLAMTDLCLAELVSAHVDQYNCHETEHNHLVIASLVGSVEGKTKRLALIGYGRKSIGDFMMRKAKFEPILLSVKKYMEDIEDHQRYYGRKRVSLKPINYIIN